MISESLGTGCFVASRHNYVKFLWMSMLMFFLIYFPAIWMYWDLSSKRGVVSHRCILRNHNSELNTSPSHPSSVARPPSSCSLFAIPPLFPRTCSSRQCLVLHSSFSRYNYSQPGLVAQWLSHSASTQKVAGSNPRSGISTVHLNSYVVLVVQCL